MNKFYSSEIVACYSWRHNIPSMTRFIFEAGSNIKTYMSQLNSELSGNNPNLEGFFSLSLSLYTSVPVSLLKQFRTEE